MTTGPYDKETLAAAAASAHALSAALENLGVDPRGTSRRYLHDRMRKLGVDTSHFERETGARWTKEILESAVAASTSVNGVLRHLGIEVVGGHHTNISRRIRAYGIDTSHFRKSPHDGVPNQRSSPHSLLIEQEPSTARRQPSSRLKRAMTAHGVTENCALCGLPALWQGLPLPLEVDHLDGDWRNNRLENLRLLCPNCHATTDTYRGRNKGRRA
ncbi:HNH endonuclease [Streptomyces sp. NPDC048664]|uniref:HNH endonuclease signature motif containing protein n=1 Tax=Streptomyces sp. NPDC048664 TaxID=3154505 RepID=UPI0034126E9C